MTHLPLSPRSAKSARGVYLATVEENPDTEKQKFRVVVTFDVMGETIKRPARVVVPMAGGERGAYFLPDKGEQVLVVFEHGDPSRPIVIGAAWSEKRKPPETNDSGDNHTKLIRTPKGHRMIFCDKPGAETLTIVDRTGSNLIQIDSVAQKIAIQTSGDLKIVAKKDAIFHGQSVNIASQGQFSATAKKEVLVHAAQKFDVFASAPVTVIGQKAINMDQQPACKVVGTGIGKVEGVSEVHVSESQQADTANQMAAAKAAEQAEQAAKTQQVEAAAMAAQADAAAAIAAAQAQQPALPDMASELAAADGLSMGQMLGIAALGAGVGAGIGAAAAFLGGKGAAGAAGAAAAAAGGAAAAPAAAAGGATSLSGASADVGADAAPTGAPAASAFAQEGGAASPSSIPSPGDSTPPHSTGPQAGMGRIGDVGSDVRGRASVTATASASGIDVETSSASSVFQEAAVSRATNPAQVPDVAVRSAQQVEDLNRRGDVEGEVRSAVPAAPLQPTPPVVEPHSAAASVAPASVRSAAETESRVETATSDVRATVSEPEQVSEAAARARAEEQLMDAGVRPMAVKGDLNTKEGTYGDPNMLARTKRDHEIGIREAEARLKVADAQVSETVSVSTQEEPKPSPATKVPDPKAPKPKKPEPESK